MEFNEKLQNLRKRRGLTQEELAKSLYVSRTAISKWESGRGYPEIESLKAISKFFSVTLDELLSSDEILAVAKEDNDKRAQRFLDLAYGLSDVCSALLLFLPLFASRDGERILSVSLMSIKNIQPYLKGAYFVSVIAMTIMGILTLSLIKCQDNSWTKIKRGISISLGVATLLLFVASTQPYAATFVIALLTIKVILLIKRQ